MAKKLALTAGLAIVNQIKQGMDYFYNKENIKP